MSIYFQYPAIDEYPQFLDPLQTEAKKLAVDQDEDNLNGEQILALRDYLTLKQL
ncbi:hypothetical protein [uncultured Pedobacter sp.]|uniref:hypothetical protein n=1 Tax=uncultured Pedobacter sp. TaxID=246139 RepID=UPI0025D15673|nr:hypothetical protein [uncultured Pedobacter sp.]